MESPQDIHPDQLEERGHADDAYNAEGVDRTLVQWMLSLTPAERLAVLQAHVRTIGKLRDAAQRS
jgi:hypothetical protein